MLTDRGMQPVCAGEDLACAVHVLTATLHALQIYCALLAAILFYCCGRCSDRNHQVASWRWQSVRGVSSVCAGAVWSCVCAAAWLRPHHHMPLYAATLAPASWTAAAWLHTALHRRRLASALLYLCLYWLLAAAASGASLCIAIVAPVTPMPVDFYLHVLSTLLCLIIAAADGICFYDEIANKNVSNGTPEETRSTSSYQHLKSHFYSKITFFWMNKLLRKGYQVPLEQEDLGELPEEERSEQHYNKFKNIYDQQVAKKTKNERTFSMWQCYVKMVWPNFYISGVLKLFGDILGLVPPLGLSVIVQFTMTPLSSQTDSEVPVTASDFINNGYIMILIITMSSIGQAILSQNSTHLVSVEGIRLKTALQGMIFDKCMRLTPWTAASTMSDEKEPLLKEDDYSRKKTYSGLVTNLVSQDTYNIMSCVWVCHYIWAIPLKVGVILYLLYNKLGISAIIGCAASILFITPLQFYIGKKISDNSKEISKTSDHRVSKMTEILEGITVIKLYVWEDIFKEKILHVREVELKLLNKDSIYWGILTFITQISTILVTVITFTTYYAIENSRELSPGNVFTGLALFSQLSVPLLVLPVTVLMVIQATISTNRVEEFLNLTETNNINEKNAKTPNNVGPEKPNGVVVETMPVNSLRIRKNKKRSATQCLEYKEANDDIKPKMKILLQFRNAIFTWGCKVENSLSLEVDDLDLEKGKLIMVIGPNGSGKSSLLSAVLGEMELHQGDVTWNGCSTTWYSGQPPWLLEASVRDNIVMESIWCPTRYARVLRCTGLKPDLQLLPEGDKTILGSRGAPLSGGQRVRLGIARALYSEADLLVLDEPLGALDAGLARQVVARGLLPAARSGKTVLIATNRLELLHYADVVIIMEDCRVVSWGESGKEQALCRWKQLAAEARMAAARADPAWGAARERARLVRVLSKAKLRRVNSDEASIGVNEATGAHLLAEVPTCAGGSWRRRVRGATTTLTRQLSSPTPSSTQLRCRRSLRRTVSADAGLRREASVLRRLLRQKPHRTISRWTPRPLRRLLSANSSDNNLRMNGNFTTVSVENGDVHKETREESDDSGEDSLEAKEDDDEADDLPVSAWRVYGSACGWWGPAYCCAAVTAQALAVAADCSLASWTSAPQTNDQMWMEVCRYAGLCACGAVAAAGAQAASAAAGRAARRVLHERLLHAALHASLQHHAQTPLGATLHRFSADILVIDKKLPTTVCRWAQLALLCGAATLVNAVTIPWSLAAAFPAFALYLTLQTVYRHNARELQRLEAASAAPAASLVSEVRAGAVTVRAGRLQAAMRAHYLQRLDRNHNALLLLNAANRWLGLTLDLVGAGYVCVWLCAACAGVRGGDAGLAGVYSLLLPAYLAHVARAQADLDLQLAAVERVHIHTRAPQENYKEHCTHPETWPANGEIRFEKVGIQHEASLTPTLSDVTLTIAPGEKVAICGRSGCGKSTLLLSCVGAAPVSSGRLLVGGIRARSIPLRTLRHRLVLLPQEGALFAGTLRENLDPLAVHTDAEIWHSLRTVGLYEYVTSQPAGLECAVDSAWSGGRVARMSTARALLRAPLCDALLLDEPGAALDAGPERALLAAVAAAAPHTTILTVAHRVSSVRDYDRVVVIERGRIIEQGSPAALLSDPASRFARMFAAASRDPCTRFI